MALIKCPECGKEISDKAATCPNCGCPISEKSSTKMTYGTPIPAKGSTQKKRGHGCLIAILVFLFICFAIGMMARSGNSSLTVTSENESEESSDAISITKEEAAEIDSEIWNYMLPIINANNDFMKIIESGSSLDIYNAAESFADMCRNAWSSAPEVSDENANQYLDSCKDFILYEQIMAESFMTYIDSGKTSDLSEAQKNIETCNEALSVAMGNRGSFLVLNGFTDEEIEEIANNLGIEE